MKKISVIMASCLIPYPNCASNRDKKYIRAVNSFLNQSYPNKELIISCDGCLESYEIYKKNWGDKPEIKAIIMDKQPIYSGEVRTAALKEATGDIICYLDNDDVFGKNHLQLLADQFTDDVDWVYYNDYLVMSPDFKKLMMRDVGPRYGSIGTSSFSHKNLPILEEGIFSNGYGHDFLAIMKLAAKGLKFKKLDKPLQYLVCHYGSMGQPGSGDF